MHVGDKVSTFLLWFTSVLTSLVNFQLPVGLTFGQLLFTPILLVMLYYMIFAFFGIETPIFTRDAATKVGKDARGWYDRVKTRSSSRSSTSLTATDSAKMHVYDKDGTRLL